MEHEYFSMHLPLTTHQPCAIAPKTSAHFRIVFDFTSVSKTWKVCFSCSYNVCLTFTPPSNFSHLSNTKPLPSCCHPDMINLRNFSSITAFNRLLGFSYLVSSHFHASPTLHCSTTVIYIYNRIHSFSTFSFEN